MNEAKRLRTYKQYVIGFVGSLICTITAFVVVDRHILALWQSVWLIAGLALVQFILQIALFLHIGEELRPRWRLVTFGFMALVVLILVGGSIWIMYNLNYRMTSRMTSQQINTYMTNQDGGL
jgi:cytochrome o ubiquinol oxidase operon protein cyoD